MKIIETSPTLVSTTRTGKNKYWRALILEDGNRYYTQSEYWQEGSKAQTSTPYESTPKNVGKANQTSAKDQAIFEYKSIIQKQLDKGYAEVGTKSNIRQLPMLAQTFEKRKKSLTYPVICQPKLDGNRMLQNNTECWSRGGKDMVKAAVAHLTFDTKGHTIDGELILPGNVPLEETSRALKSYKPGISEQLAYIVYDIISDKPYNERLEILKNILKTAPANVMLIPSFVAKNENEVLKLHKKFVKQGYEGIIVRDNSAGYDVNHRSTQLQKHKDFVDSEFKIVAVHEGEGSEKGLAIFECVTEKGNNFRVRPEGSTEHREELWKNRQSLIGQWLTVKYQTFTKSNEVPQFPVGITIREDGEF